MWAQVAENWRQPDRYAWMLDYLRSRGLANRVRLLIAAATASYIVLPVSMLWSPAGPQGWHRAAAMGAAGAVLLSAAAVTWRWPSQRWAIYRAVIAIAGTVVVCASYADVMVGLAGCTTFAMLGGYIAFFHSVRLQAVNLGLGMLTATVLTIRALTTTDDVIATLNVYVVVAVTIFALPATAHALALFLHGDLDTFDTDPLTGLLNRRAFYRAAHQLLATADRSTTRYFSVLMVDLDDFKRLNDSRGHRAGDMALIEVGRRLAEHADDRAVVARVGGEEFLIADMADSDAAQLCATRVCEAINGIEFDITASVGIASAELSTHPVGRDRALIDRLIDDADSAMYDAKRAGGNQARSAP